MNFKKIVGGFLIFFVLAVLFTLTAIDVGLCAAVFVWAIAIVLAAVLIAGVFLL